MISFTMKLSDIQPSQLYISEVKLKKVQSFLDNQDLRNLEPIPVKKIGDTVFFTDGHTRAFALMAQGVQEVEVCWDQDDLDWLQYLICVAWCEKANIREIAHLSDRVVDHSTYRRLWHKRCDVMQKAVLEGDYEAISIEHTVHQELKSSISETILRALPNWFGIEQALKNYVSGVVDTDLFTLKIEDRPIGFISLLDHNQYTSEIYCMGIYQDIHRRGLGKMLMTAAENFLLKQGKKFLTVKTLGDSFPDQAYIDTKMFYRSRGFFPLEESKEIWGEETPCLIMVKPLNNTTGGIYGTE